ncbi:hypothetical protein GCM10023197_25760 [Gordonia humi]|uniref:Helix-turn-helix domain-containing protein n=1 Tax=Gordonia humi TaxID=686429 RepID=A0A840EWG9_9ACTN|nr:hypothetical protein [Gordonia humi]
MRMTVQDAAKAVGRSIWTIRDYVLSGQLPAVRTGPLHAGGWQIDLTQLLDVMEARKALYHNRPYKAGPGRGHCGKPAGPLTQRGSE